MLIVFLTSCNSANERRYTSYICASVNDGIGVSTEIDFWNGSYYKKQNITDKTCFVYGKKYTATYSKSIIDKMNSYTTDIYVDKNYIEFGLRSDTGDLAFFNLMNADFFNTEPYLPEVKNPLDVATSLAYEIACEYVDDITKYTKLVDEPITNYKEKDGVTHEITYYIITFAKKSKWIFFLRLYIGKSYLKRESCINKTGRYKCI